jgi:hypothetical protein
MVDENNRKAEAVWEVKGKAIPAQRPTGVEKIQAPRISRHSAHECGKVVSPTHWPPLPRRKDPWYSYLLETSQPQGPSATEEIESMKDSTDPIGNRTRDLPICGAVPQPTAPPRTPRSTTQNTNPGLSKYKVVLIWPRQTVTCLHTISPGHIWTTLYYGRQQTTLYGKGRKQITRNEKALVV